MRRSAKKLDLGRLEHALCTLADYEDIIKRALCEAPGVSGAERDHGNVCEALRAIVDEGFR